MAPRRKGRDPRTFGPGAWASSGAAGEEGCPARRQRRQRVGRSRDVRGGSGGLPAASPPLPLQRRVKKGTGDGPASRGFRPRGRGRPPLPHVGARASGQGKRPRARAGEGGDRREGRGKEGGEEPKVGEGWGRNSLESPVGERQVNQGETRKDGGKGPLLSHPPLDPAAEDEAPRGPVSLRGLPRAPPTHALSAPLRDTSWRKAPGINH